MPPRKKMTAQQAMRAAARLQAEALAVLKEQEAALATETVFTGEWDIDVHRCTSNFQVDGAAIRIKICDGDDVRVYQISQWRLASKLPEFSQMVTTYHDESPITVCHDVRDFEDFLWFLHVDPVNYLRYTTQCPAAEKFRRALGIGIIAHFYNVANIRQWAIDELSERVNSCVELKLLPRLYRLAADCRDPVAALLASKQLADVDLQAHAYAYILKTSHKLIAGDGRLTTLDRLRLTLGSLNLKLYPCHCLTRSSLPRCMCIKDTYGERSLWDLFTRSDMGFSLVDSTGDLSALSLPHPSGRTDGDVKLPELALPQPPSNPAENKPCTIM